MVIPKLPILAPRRGRDVLLLSFALHVGFLVLRRVEHGFRLLRRHSGNRLWGRRLVLARRGRRTLGLALASAPASSSTSATAATAFFLPQRQLVVPSGIRVSDGDFENLLVAIERAVEGSVGGILFGATSLYQLVEAEVESRVMANFRIL